MSVCVDDVGSFPLPTSVDRGVFNRAYVLAREGIVRGRDVRRDEFLLNNFCGVVVDSFRKKCASGLDVVNYPQHYDMHVQFAEVIHKAMDEGTYVVEEKAAIIPEVWVIEREAKRLYEETGKKVLLRVSVTGPMELYLKEVGTVAYEDVFLMFAESVRRFARNSVLDSKFVKTEVVSLDEPSFGFQDVSADRDTLLDVLEKAFDFGGAVKQVHLHSASRVADLLSVRNLDVLSFEYAASPRNIESLSGKMLDRADKRVRVGVSRTDINSIMSELYDKGVTQPGVGEIVESEGVIRKRFVVVREKYGDRLAFAGPDCGLGGWPTQDAAQLVLKRTVSAVKSAIISH
jgi:5-methyltetrahydropteroyltriglutamate--homocysteine methyltransferase